MAEEDDQVTDMGDQTPLSPRIISPMLHRRSYSARSLDRHRGAPADEHSSLLDNIDTSFGRSYRSIAPSTPGTPRAQPLRQLSYTTNTRFSRNATRRNSFAFSQRLVNALGAAVSRPDAAMGKY